MAFTRCARLTLADPAARVPSKADGSPRFDQDPIGLAFLAAAKERRLFDHLPAVTPVSFTPSDAKTRCTEAVVEQHGQRMRVMKGAVRAIAAACGLPVRR